MQNSILIHAPIGREAELTQIVLGAAGIAAKVCRTIEELIRELDLGVGAVLTVEEALGSALQPLADFVAGQPAWSDVPILVLTQRGADAPSLSRALDLLGNVTLLERPVRTLALVSALRTALRARQKQFQVREGSQRKDEFLASLGHELRNPLAPIRNSMGILKHLYPGVPAVSKVSTVVERQVTHLTRLVDDLLDVARITNGKIVLQPETFFLPAVIEHVLELAAPSAQVKLLTVETEVPQEQVELLADYARVIQIVANILINSIKFTPPHGHIWLRARVEGASVVFTVRDTGIGIERGVFESIFDLFAQLKPVAGPVTSGLGIGLNLSKRFTEMHHGTIKVDSEGLGHGSEFTVSLPIVIGVTEHVAVDEADQPHTESASTRPSILVVDDNQDAANMLQALFEFERFDVATAYDGFDAIAAVQKHMPNFIVMDLGMPGIDGYDTVRRIRSQPGAAGITIVALTGWGQSDARTKTAAAGFDHHMVKPVDFDALRRLIGSSHA
ncbi:MAG: response regulator [Herminiimonas sp.]|nr:response regulator [Herminiimonas sp.]